MVYFYAVLGMCMMAGIMAIFEMGLALAGRSLLPSPVDPYLSNTQVKVMDQKLMTLLADREAVAKGLLGTSLCEKVIASYNEEYVQIGGVNPWLQDEAMPINTGRWAGSCVMNDGSHHVVVKPDLVDGTDPYQLYSCVLKRGTRCSFEHD